MGTLTRKKEDIFFKKIDNVLTEVFGKEATLIIYRYIERHYALRQNEFSDRIDLFAKGLEDCLSAGAIPIETKILNALYGIPVLIQNRALMQ